MNIILYLIIIFFVLLYSYYLFKYNICEKYGNDNGNGNENDNTRYGLKFYDYEKLKFNKYDQNKSFIPDIYNYNFNKDTNILRDINGKINFKSVEYKNLDDKIKIKKEINDTNKKKYKIKNKNFIEPVNYPIIRKELNILQIDQIFNNVKHKYSFDNFNRIEKDKINFKSEPINNNLHSFKLIKKWLMTILYKESDNEIYKIPYFNDTIFKYRDDKILYYEIDYENNLELLKFKLRLYRENKELHYIVYFEIIIDNFELNYYIQNIFLLSIDIEENINFGEFKQNINYNLENNKTPLNMIKNNKQNDKYFNNYKENVNNYLLKSRKKDFTNYQNNDNSYCFYKNALNKTNCISLDKNTNKVGLWDNPCRINEDCPFYKKNLNYPNKRGECKNGFCEMPVNVNLLGYKKFNNTPLCYNCIKDDYCKGLNCNMCCEEQKNKKIYPNLKSPDYVFENDFNERLNYSNLFKDNNYSPIQLSF